MRDNDKLQMKKLLGSLKPPPNIKIPPLKMFEDLAALTGCTVSEAKFFATMWIELVAHRLQEGHDVPLAGQRGTSIGRISYAHCKETQVAAAKHIEGMWVARRLKPRIKWSRWFFQETKLYFCDECPTDPDTNEKPYFNEEDFEMHVLAVHPGSRAALEATKKNLRRREREGWDDDFDPTPYPSFSDVWEGDLEGALPYEELAVEERVQLNPAPKKKRGRPKKKVG